MRGRGLNNIIYDPMHMRVGNLHIFVDPGASSKMTPIVPTIRAMNHKRNFKFHVFLFSRYVLEDESKTEFIAFINELFGDPTDMPKVTIHIPNRMSDMKVLCEHVLEETNIPKGKKDHYIKYALERKGCKFKIPRGPKAPYFLTFDYSSGKIDLRVEVRSFEALGFDPPFRAFGGSPGAVKNLVQAVHPELFKDKILEAFKKSCPEGILKSFKSDEEIWNYITENGEWSLKEGQ